MTELMTAWMAESLRVLEGVPSLGLLATIGDAAADWRAMLNALDEAYKLDRAWWLAFSSAAGCATPLAAHQSGRDIVYLVSGSLGGAAVRYAGGENYRQMPESLNLPRAGLRAVLELDARLDAVDALPPADLIGRSGLIDEVRRRIGEDIVGPLLNRWPDLKIVTVIPLGTIQRLPLATALVESTRFNALVDVTVAPNAAGVLVAANGGVCTAEVPVVVMADPADGEGELGWIESEALAVAGIYGRSPDLLVDYGHSGERPVLYLQTGFAATPESPPDSGRPTPSAHNAMNSQQLFMRAVTATFVFAVDVSKASGQCTRAQLRSRQATEMTMRGPLPGHRPDPPGISRRARGVSAASYR